MSTLKDGEAKLKTAQSNSDKTLPQTSPQGQANIRQDGATLQQEWDTLTARMKSVQQTLNTALQALETYDTTCDSLNRWLRDTEIQLKECELKSTLAEKEAQVDKLKVRF